MIEQLTLNEKARVPMTVAVGDSVTLTFPQADDADPVLYNALVVSATNSDSDDKDSPDNPVLNLAYVSGDGGYNDRHGRQVQYAANVPHENDYLSDDTGSAGPALPYWS